MTDTDDALAAVQAADTAYTAWKDAQLAAQALHVAYLDALAVADRLIESWGSTPKGACDEPGNRRDDLRQGHRPRDSQYD